MEKKSIALVGARGYVGQELVQLIGGHPILELVWAGSRQLKGQKVCDHFPHAPEGLIFSDPDPDTVSNLNVDVIILALPNNLSKSYVEAIKDKDAIIIDLSADHRFEDIWTYGLPEINRNQIRTSKHIANPGCYATAMMLGLWPLRRHLSSAPACFGVSGYSGAGTSPSRKNDLNELSDNLIPYSLTGHIHEQEVTRHLGHKIAFTPHVTSFFRGLTVTITAQLKNDMQTQDVEALFQDAYGEEPFVQIQPDPAEPKKVANAYHALIGGISADETGRVSLVSGLDNLLKGAASQAMQNINLALGLNETTGLLNR